MGTFKVTKDRRVFLDDMEITRVLGFSIVITAANDPEVVIRIAVDNVDIDGYTDAFTSRKFTSRKRSAEIEGSKEGIT